MNSFEELTALDCGAMLLKSLFHRRNLDAFAQGGSGPAQLRLAGTHHLISEPNDYLILSLSLPNVAAKFSLAQAPKIIHPSCGEF
jgi:hypothetical protein